MMQFFPPGGGDGRENLFGVGEEQGLGRAQDRDVRVGARIRVAREVGEIMAVAELAEFGDPRPGETLQQSQQREPHGDQHADQPNTSTPMIAMVATYWSRSMRQRRSSGERSSA